ncbi:MAG: acyltransferase [Pedobacter sp.]|uniref:acyltransferase n=1 Tax=Pedobacter sp. TaxID=1411316 RepID=UPI0028066A2F|nr:acyltransferase [Pedobacter sp.]MDQ8004879.1 acyltransferase [Pedobacter sp.]
MKYFIESLFFRIPNSIKSRFKILIYRFLGARIGKKNRFEKGLLRRATQIEITDHNTFTSTYKLWPEDTAFSGKRIIIGSYNYFNKNMMLDACGMIQIGDYNMFGPDVYITDSNHTFGDGISPQKAPMQRGKVKIGNHCWIGAKTIILKDVELGDYCVVGAGSVVTKSFPNGSIIGGVPAKHLSKKTE